eukprot:TRINITY_DN18512_c0_g1_i5.p1 TRINITY_DN18512_c0_g1~~TRINITY_DN18512_c0_g1_i5.p1  ORF type:complete len:115 (+),score=13.99 TRINITY_DN18512_c0_g1_i5:2211-2555(+)
MDIFSSWNVVVLSCRGKLLEAAPFSHFSGEIWLKGSDRVCRDGLSLPSPESLKKFKTYQLQGSLCVFNFRNVLGVQFVLLLPIILSAFMFFFSPYRSFFLFGVAFTIYTIVSSL